MTVLISIALTSFPAFAAEQQVAAEAAPEVQSEASPPSVCVTKVAHISEKEDRQVAIAIPADKADEFVRRGFARTDCGEVRMTTPADRREVCKVAEAANFAVSMAYWQKFSMTPEESCRLVRGSKAAM